MKDTPSTRKSAQTVRDKIAMILMTEISDPRVSLVTVTETKVSKDRSVCNVYVSTDPDRYDEVVEGLESAKGRIRSLLGRSLGWRVTPELRFMIDTVPDEAERISRALMDVPPTMSIPKDEEGNPVAVDSDEGGR